ncbi:MAG: CBS and ACT domain-containing protein [Spirochaetaceae bacterium]
MTVERIMTRNPFTVTLETSVMEAQKIIRREKVHRLPVLDRHHALVGIVSEKDLLYASPSPASTLNVYEMSSLLMDLKVAAVMTKEVVTVTPDTLIEDAAREMVDHDIGGLPVMSEATVVGIITESDLFKLFIELFGTRQSGLRATMLLPDHPGEIAQLSSAIAEAGGNIISLGTFPGTDPTNAILTIKVDGMDPEMLERVSAPLVTEIIDVRRT